MSLRFAVAAVVGIVVGYASGNPYLGFQTFALVYGSTGFLDPNKKVFGPRLQDLKAPQASYGSPIPYVVGAPRLAGIYVWATSKREIANEAEQAGKGGPGVTSTTYTYEVDALIMVADNVCAGIRRVWSNGKLVWSSAEDADAETFIASAHTTSWREMRFHSGADDQLPDPTYEAAVGVGNAPAYRGRATVMLEGLNLGASGQLPVLTFEVVSHASFGARAEVFAEVPSAANFNAGSSPFSPSGFRVHVGQWDNGYVGSEVAVFDVGSDGLVSSVAAGVYTAKFNQPTASGTVDIDGLLTGYLRDVTWHEGPTGLQFNFQLPIGESFGQDNGRFCIKGDDVVLGGNSGSTKVHRFSKIAGAGGFFDTPIVSSASLASPASGIATDGTLVYVARASSNGPIDVLDMATLSLQSTIPFPTGASTGQGGVPMVDDGVLYFAVDGPYPGNVWRWTGAAWVVAFPSIYLGYTVRNAQWGMNGGVPYVMTAQFAPAGKFQIHGIYTTIDAAVVPLDEVVSALCLRTKQLTADDIDVTALAGQNVRAMAISQVSATRSTLEMLAGIYLFEWCEGEKLKAVLRGGAPVATIPYRDLGVSDDGNAEPVPKKRANDIEIPAQVTVKFGNVLNDFQDGAETSDRLTTDSTAVSVIEVPLGLTPGEAKRVADANALDLAVSELQIGPLTVSARKYAHLEATDVVLVVARDGSTFRVRIVKGTIGSGVLTLEDVLDDASAINSQATTDSAYQGSSLVRMVSQTELQLLDIPILRDADNAPGLYVAGKPAGGGRSSGFELDKSIDGTSYTKVLDSTARAVMGVASTTLGNFSGGNVFDETNTLTVDVDAGTLASSTRAAMLDGTANAMLVGSEVIQFRSASLLSPGVYLLSGFLRGRRGTEWAIPSHAASERVVLLSTSTLRRAADEAADIGIAYQWKAVSFGKSRATAPAQVFTDAGVALKPFAPVDLRLNRNGASAVFTWHRRSRLSGRLFQGDPPLGEASEQYDVELRDATDAVVASTTVSSASYTASSLKGGDYIIPPLWGMRVVSGDRMGVREDNPLGSQVAFKAASIVTLNSTGGVAETSATLGNQINQWVAAGTAIYATLHNVAATSPESITSSKVVKLTKGTLATIDATNTATTPGDYQGVAHDGTNVWVSEWLSGNLRKLNASTLASVASYAFAGGAFAMQHAAGKLYIVCLNSYQLVRWDIATQTEDYRVSCTSHPVDVLVVGSLVFVRGDGIDVRNAATGALVASYSDQGVINLPGRTMTQFGSYVAVSCSGVGGFRILLLDTTTGLTVDTVASPTAFLGFPAGSVGSDLYLTGSEGSGFSWRTRAYTLAPPGLAGYSLTVWQRSQIVGRGYPATLEL